MRHEEATECLTCEVSEWLGVGGRIRIATVSVTPILSCLLVIGIEELNTDLDATSTWEFPYPVDYSI